MTDPQHAGGWPDAERPGVPMHPERGGWCWLSYSLPRIPQVAPSCFRWSADNDAWMVNNSPINPANMARLGWYFVARVLTPAEVAARVEAARREGIEEAAKVATGAARQWLMQSQRQPHRLPAAQAAVAIEAEIRALLEDGR